MRIAVAGAAVVFLLTGGIAGANVSLTRVSADPYTNATSQHATEVEPDTFAYGNTVVAAFQVGRFVSGGSTDTGVVRSGNGGTSWDPPAFLHLTFPAGASTAYERVTDPSVAYDAAHGVWLVASLPLLPNLLSTTVLVNRSTDDGRTWSAPVSLPLPALNNVNLDKDWIVCDNNATSPFRGHCYVEVDNFGTGDTMLMSTSTDGGRTWSTPIRTDGNDKGLGGQPLVQPNGRVIVPFASGGNSDGTIQAFSSTNGGASWTAAVKVANVRFHTDAGSLRSSALPSAEIAADGRVFVAWPDCRFRKNCPSNDIVFSTSTDGATWTDPARVPIDDVTGGADYFIPGLAVDPATSGAGTHLALTYYFYPDATCSGGCQLDVGYISSPDAGAHWGAPVQLAGPMTLGQIAPTSQGPMVGDYISTSISGGKATTVFAVGRPPSGAAFDEAMYAPAARLAIASLSEATRSASTAGATANTSSGNPHFDRSTH